MNKEVESGTISRLLLRIISSSPSSFALFICLFAVTLAYRIQLTIGLFTNPVKPFDFNPALHRVWFMSPFLPYDLLLILGFFLFSWLGSRFQFFAKPGRRFPFLSVSGFVFLHLLLILMVLIHGIHGRLLFDVQSGLDFSVLKEAFSNNISFVDIMKTLNVKDYLFLLLPIFLFWVVLLSPLGFRIWMARISFLLLIVLSFTPALAAYDKHGPIPGEIRLNPALYLLSDVAENRLLKHPAQSHHRYRIDDYRSGMQLTDLAYSNPTKPVTLLPPKAARPWNIVFFIMESVGSRYIFDTSHGNPMPMPFLHRMAKESWHLGKHYTTSNFSTKGVFSLLSGLYDEFNRQTFGTNPEAEVPSLHNFLPENYDRFLVTPSSVSWYFPAAFVKNSGLREIHSYENLNFKTVEEFHSLGHYIARDETQTVDFFVQRLTKAREPFMGIYISFAAHFPYFDYGPEYRIMEDDGRSISRYYNNLNLLDHMIKRIYDHLEERGLLERTIFVIVGDHGQAFGQHHPDNFMHYRYSYSENLEAPAILYQPALFRPRTFDFPTTHVDILPTLLDAMRIPYDPLLFDGESLFHTRLRRKYIFFYGYEESLSSLDDHQVKVQYSLRRNRCQAFDLKFDPGEKNPLDCSAYDRQLDALRTFASYHDSNLIRYNASLREKKDFNGHRHPSLNLNNHNVK